MKTLRKVILMAAFGLTSCVFASNAQEVPSNAQEMQSVVVKSRPVSPHIVRMASPGPQYVWIGDEWSPSNGTYVYRGGRWAMPPQPGQRWIPGRWAGTRAGFVWIPGRWR